MRQVSTEDEYSAVDVLCAILLEQRNQLQDQLAEAQAQIAASAADEPPAPSSTTPSSDLEAAMIALQTENARHKAEIATMQTEAEEIPQQLPGKKEWRDTMRSKDISGKEAEKWN